MARATTTTATSERYAKLTKTSHDLWERAVRVLPGGNTRTTTFQDPYPLYLVRGEGCRVFDVDGIERIDFISNYTSLVLGHCHPRVVAAVQRQAAQLMSAAAPSELEVELAERLRERLPSMELIRFANSGTEATMQAIRVARAFTDRTTVATFAGAYHGTHDYASSIPATAAERAGGTGIPAGVASSLVVAPFNDAEGTRAVLEPHFDDLAAVIVEPVQGAAGVIPARQEFLASLRELADEAGALLIFDEVIAFRIGYHGAQGQYGIIPDLTALGKIIGGGLAIGAFGGRADVMALFDPRNDRRLGHGGTFNGNPLTMAAGLATLTELTPEALDRLEKLTLELKAKLEQLFADVGLPALVTQSGSLFNLHLREGEVLDHSDVLASDTTLLQELHLAMLGHGVLFTPRGMGCLSIPMTDSEVDAFAEAARLGLRDLGVV
ncbi:MAG TPA: aspartate aminotransferase family protein [Gaiellaceae bacterium]|nr:aspartate aminotransferase family protein [Gaiellaceae bacterium]